MEAVRLHPGEKLLGLAGPSLPAPKLGKARERVDVAPRPQRAQLVHRRRELLVGTLPVAVPQQHVRVGRAADREHLTVREARRDVAHPQAPLVRPLEVPDQLARVDHVAAHGLDRVRIDHLAADRGGGGGVEPPHAVVDLAGADQSEAVYREREHLDVDRSDLAGERDRLRRMPPAPPQGRGPRARTGPEAPTPMRPQRSAAPPLRAARRARPSPRPRPALEMRTRRARAGSRAVRRSRRPRVSGRGGSHARAPRSRHPHRARSGRRGPPPRTPPVSPPARARRRTAPVLRPTHRARAPPARPRSLYWARPSAWAQR